MVRTPCIVTQRIKAAYSSTSAVTRQPSTAGSIRMHSSLGHALLAGVTGLADARDLVLGHHEYWDGSGYPEGRRGADSPHPARVFCLVDSYEAIVRDDVGYRARRDHDIARDEILELASVRYDPELAAVFRGLDRAAWRAVAEQHPG